MPQKAALYTGSFDPLTRGHLDLIERAAAVFGWVYVGVATSPAKKYLFQKAERFVIIKEAVAHLGNVTVIYIPDSRLTADIAFEKECVVIKGMRINADFDYERLLHDISHMHQLGLDTFILPAQPHLGHISSTAAKEVCKLNGNTEEFVLLPVKQEMEKMLLNQHRIGITGTIGSGKSTITKELVKQLKELDRPAHDLDIDAIAGDIMFKREEPAYCTLRAELQDMLEIPEWDRKHIGEVIFNNEAKRLELSKRLHSPLMTRIRAELHGKEGYIFVNCALLCEAGLLPFVNNQVVVLDVAEDIQVARLLDRGHDESQIERRVKSQLNTKQKLEIIDKAIVNTGHGNRKLLQTDLVYAPEECARIIIHECLPLI